MFIRYCILSLVLLVWGCSGKQNAEEVALAFNDAITRSDFKKAKQFASSRSIQKLEKFEELLDALMQIEREKKKFDENIQMKIERYESLKPYSCECKDEKDTNKKLCLIKDKEGQTIISDMKLIKENEEWKVDISF